MYFDRRLWQLTRGLRGWTAFAIFLGLVAAVVGIARFAILGVLLSHVFNGAGLIGVAGPAIGVAGAVILRGVIEHHRAMVSHRTAARVQEELRGRLYDKIAELGPAWFAGERTGGVMLSIVDGVEQLQTFFGQYIPQLSIAVLTPVAIFAFIAFWDVPVAAVMLFFALVTLIAPTVFIHVERRSSQGRQQALKSFGSEFLDGVQGLPTLKAFGQSRAFGRRLAERARELCDSSLRVLSTGVMTRGITDCGVAIGAAAALALAAWRVSHGRSAHSGAADRVDGRNRGVPSVARSADGPASRDAGTIGGRRHQCAVRGRATGAASAGGGGTAGAAAPGPCAGGHRIGGTCTSHIPADAAPRMTASLSPSAAAKRLALSGRADRVNLRWPGCCCDCSIRSGGGY